jgi:DNA (cytosine-5)-methyltransferase 1
MALRSIELCAGYGGFTLGLRDHDVSTVAYVERDSYAAAVLVARMEEERLDHAPIWDDLCTFDGSAWRGRVDIVTAGFPCQPFSTAGLQRGLDDERWIWPDIARIVADVQPRFVFLENVTGLIRAGLGHVLTDLARLGFNAEWGVLSAAAVGAPHRRQRVWILADSASVQFGTESKEPGVSQRVAGRRDAFSPLPDMGDADSGRRETVGQLTGIIRQGILWNADGPKQSMERVNFPPARDDADGWQRWTASGGPQPAVRRITDGRPVGLADALHLGGNGLVPQVAAEAFRQLSTRKPTV